MGGGLEDLAFVEAEKAVLVRADLVDVHVVEAGVLELADRLAVAVGIGAADDGLGDLLARERLGRLPEMTRQRELLPEFAAEGRVRPPLVGRVDRLALALRPANGQLPVAGLA